MVEPHSHLLASDETQRLAALASYRTEDIASTRCLDNILLLARRILDVPIAIVSFVAEDRQVFGARLGIDTCGSDRGSSFCTHAIRGRHVMVVPDARLDERFRDSPLVTGSLGARFYAGAPLVTPEGLVIGTLCVKDTVPRPRGLSEGERQSLAELAELVMDKLEVRRLSAAEADGRRRFDAVAGSAADAIVCGNGDNLILSWNAAAERMFGYTASEAVGQPMTIIVPDRYRAMHEAGVRSAASGHPSKLVGSLVTVPALRRDGIEFPIELSLSHWVEGGEHRFGAIARDITERVEHEAKLKRAADYDALTGLANRTLLERRLCKASSEGRPVSLILIDLDGFKDVNDSLGHVAGDEVLKVVARRLGETVGTEGVACRLGGDEFVVLLEDRADPFRVVEIANRLVSVIEVQMEMGERSIYVGASAGLTIMTGTGWESKLPIERSDLALYKAKSEGRGRVRLFTQDLMPTQQARASVSSGLRQAFERGELELYYQPQVRLADRSIAGAEALIRWNHPERGVLAPAAFIETLETSLIAIPVSEWILRDACRQAAEWRRSGHPDFRIGVNLFAAQFRTGDLATVVDRVLRETSLCAHGLELEITENTILRNEARIDTTLRELRDMGVGIAFDDYGTGYASLTMLKDFPVTRLKIDRSFVSGPDVGDTNRLVVEAISGLARGLDLEVIAEGIETVEQADLMGGYCGEGQGYLFGRPMVAGAFASLLAAPNTRPSLRVA